MLPADKGPARPGVRIQYLYQFDEIGRRSVDRDPAVLVQLLAQRRLDPQVALTTSWNDPVPALRALQDRTINGKVVLTVPKPSRSQA
jgi:NADPH:quinone reductase